MGCEVGVVPLGGTGIADEFGGGGAEGVGDCVEDI
jgi:hypothetical protein